MAVAVPAAMGQQRGQHMPDWESCPGTAGTPSQPALGTRHHPGTVPARGAAAAQQLLNPSHWLQAMIKSLNRKNREKSSSSHYLGAACKETNPARAQKALELVSPSQGLPWPPPWQGWELGGQRRLPTLLRDLGTGCWGSSGTRWTRGCSHGSAAGWRGKSFQLYQVQRPEPQTPGQPRQGQRPCRMGARCWCVAGPGTSPWEHPMPSQPSAVYQGLELVARAGVGAREGAREGMGQAGGQGKRADGPRTWHTAGFLLFLQRNNREMEPGMSSGSWVRHSVPSQTPAPRGWGWVRAWPTSGYRKQGQGVEVPQGAGAMSLFHSSAAAGGPGGSGVLPLPPSPQN